MSLPKHLARFLVLVAAASIAIFCVSAATAPEFSRIATLAGSSTGHDVFKGPQAVAVDLPTGIVIVADSGHHNIVTVDPRGTVAHLAGSGTPGRNDGFRAAAQFNAPRGVAVDGVRHVIYVADTGNHLIRRVSFEGAVTTFAGSGRAEDHDGVGIEASFKQPVGLALDSAGNVYVADSGNDKIRQITPAGVVTTFAGAARSGYANGPALQALFKQPEGVAIDRNGVLFIADTMNNVVRKIENGFATTVAGTGHGGYVEGAAAVAEFKEPTAVTIDDTGVLYIADRLNHAIRAVHFRPDAVDVTTIAGGGQPGFVDGLLSTSRLQEPAGIAMNGALFVADSKNDAIRVIYPLLQITSISPTRGPVAGGNVVHIFGAGFVPGANDVSFGTTTASVTYVSSTELLVDVPQGAPGAVNVAVTSPAGTKTLTNAYTYIAPPIVTAINPAKGPSAGGQATSIFGLNFVPDDTAVTFGGVNVPNVTVVSPNSLTLTTPPHTPGAVDVTIATAGGTATLPNAYSYLAAPSIQSFFPTSAQTGTLVTITGSNFDPDAAGNQLTFGGANAVVVSATTNQLIATVPANASTGKIVVRTAGGSAESSAAFTVIRYTAIAITPSTKSLAPGETAEFIASATATDGNTLDITAAAVWTSSDSSIASVTGGVVNARSAGSATITVSFAGLTAAANVTVAPSEPLPPDPTSVATPIDPTIATSFSASTRFLYAGANPLQFEVSSGAIDEKRVSVIRGRVLDRHDSPLAGVRVFVRESPTIGYAKTRTDGWFDLALNGGGPVMLQYEKSGFLPAQREARPGWNRFLNTADVVLVPLDAEVATIDLAGGSGSQVARSSVVTDGDGSRRATLLFNPGTSATMTLPGGVQQALQTLHVRATEYTVGANGPKAMPASLPPQSGYTYCVELSVDEALEAGASTVNFSQPVALYVDNFLGFPVGEGVPVGFYDRGRGVWTPSPNGRVVKILGSIGTDTAIDIDGDGAGDSASALAELGITNDEKTRLGTLYTPGKTLWRISVPHFSTVDANWPVGPTFPASATAPAEPRPETDAQANPDNSCRIRGSIIECESQALGQAVPITGTSLQLHYESARVPGRVSARTADVSLTGTNVPQGLLRIELTIDVAGQRHTVTYPPAPNLRHTFTWDGKDIYGRVIQGAQDARVDIAYVYETVYRPVPRNGSSFAQYSTGNPLRLARTPTTLAAVHSADFRPWDARGGGLGGWTVDVQHALDPSGNALMLGDGSKRTSTGATGTITTIAGREPTFSGFCDHIDGALGTTARISRPRQIAVGPDGSLYFADSACSVVVRLDPAGRFFWFAGVGFSGFSGDGGPALVASLNSPAGVAISRDGSIYVSEVNGQRIRRIAPDGRISTIAGIGATGTTGDGGPATAARLFNPTDLAVGPDGSVYVVQSDARVRRIAPDGIISTVVGNGSFIESGDGGPASAAGLNGVGGIAVAADGSIYIAGRSERIRRISPDGIIDTYALLGLGGNPNSGNERHLTITSDGVLYVSSNWSLGAPTFAAKFTVQRIAGDRQPVVVADGENGNPPSSPQTDAFFGGDGGPAVGALYAQPAGVAIGVDGTLYVSDTFNRRVRRIVPALARATPTGELSLASADGTTVDFFDRDGRHLRTVDSLVGTVLWQFFYDAAGHLASLRDADGNVTSIERAAGGAPLAIVAPGGQRTSMTMGDNALLASVTNPAGEKVDFGYSADGLLLEMKDAKHNAHGFGYEPSGRLRLDTDPAGGSKALSFTRSGDRFTVSTATALGRTTSYLRETLASGDTRQTITDAAGLQSVTVRAASGQVTTTLPDGLFTQTSLKADPRFGMQAPFANAATMRTPSGLSLNASEARTVSLSNSADPLSVVSAQSVLTINGKAYTRTYTASTRKLVERTPLGRTLTTFLDAKGRPTRIEVPGITADVYEYDPRGRLAIVQQGTRAWSFSYDDANRLTTITDPLTRITGFEYDAAGRMTAQTTAGQRTTFGYDANGNITAITPHDRPPHTFAYTPVDLPDSYVPPAATGSGTTRYEYNRDRQITRMTRPHAQSIALDYDNAGRVSLMTAPHGIYAYAYSATSGAPTSVSAPDGPAVTYAYDGPLLTSATWSGVVEGSVTFAYDNNYRLSTENGVPFTYDNDGLLVSAGSLTLQRDAQNGLLTTTTLAGTTDAITYDTFGAPATYSASANGAAVFNQQFTRDTIGRISRKIETVFGGATTYDYGYDIAGRLSSVKREGAVVATYDYDGNGNRLHRVTSTGTESAVYDDQDRLLMYNGVTYTYTANGELKTKTDASGTTTYDYDIFANLRHVTMPDGTLIEYVIDGQNRRVGKKVNGTLIRGWLYGSQLRIVAELDGMGVVISRFVYGSRANVPDYMIRNGITYRIISDHLGSPRLVLNSVTGDVAQMISYDEFGRVLQDSSPDFQPFGFAGGLHDTHTGFVRFGVRDYDAQSGRWTTKDPSGFAAGDTNVYGYCGDDPVNRIDPSGRIAAVLVLIGSAAGPAALATVVFAGSAYAVGTALSLTVDLIEDLHRTAAAEELLRETIRLNYESRRLGRRAPGCEYNPGRRIPKASRPPDPRRGDPDDPKEPRVPQPISDDQAKEKSKWVSFFSWISDIFGGTGGL